MLLLIVLGVTPWPELVQRVFLIALPLGTFLAVWLPRRTLHDRLAGTHFVPK